MNVVLLKFWSMQLQCKTRSSVFNPVLRLRARLEIVIRSHNTTRHLKVYFRGALSVYYVALWILLGLLDSLLMQNSSLLSLQVLIKNLRTEIVTWWFVIGSDFRFGDRCSFTSTCRYAQKRCWEKSVLYLERFPR